MPLVNLNDLTIIGPGSEWFWAMAQFVVVVVSLWGLYRQLSAQRLSNALGRITSLQRHWQSPTMALAKLQTALDLRAGRGLRGHAIMLGEFLDDIWDLYETGLLTKDEAIGNWGISAYGWWRLLEPEIERRRRDDGVRICNGFEQLAAAARTELPRLGVAFPSWDAATQAQYINLAIERNREALELYRDAEAGVIPAEAFEVDRTRPEDNGRAAETNREG